MLCLSCVLCTEPGSYRKPCRGPAFEMTYAGSDTHLGAPDLRGTQVFVLGKACNVCGLDALFSPLQTTVPTTSMQRTSRSVRRECPF